MERRCARPQEGSEKNNGMIVVFVIIDDSYGDACAVNAK